jgi:hypothetical protein
MLRHRGNRIGLAASALASLQSGCSLLSNLDGLSDGVTSDRTAADGSTVADSGSGTSTGEASESSAETGAVAEGSSSGSDIDGTSRSGSLAGSGSSGSTTSGASSGATSGSGSNATSGATNGSGASSGVTSSSGSATSGAASGSDGGATSGTSAVPYAGQPFKGIMQRIPGTIHMSDYDTGGPNVAYCHGNPGNCQQGVVTSDWTGYGGVYRPLVAEAMACGGAGCNDNAGICHMNVGAPDNYALSGPSFASGANGPTLTGPMVTLGTNVMPQDVYLCYTVSPTTAAGPSTSYEWEKYTVQVTTAGTFSIGGLAGSPAGVTVSFDFGNGITSGTVAIPPSNMNGCNCNSVYDSWEFVSNLGTVTIPAPGVYVMTFTLLTQQFNPDYFTFTKM